MEKLKVVFHVNEPGRWDMTLLNIRRLLLDVGEEAVDIVVMANGPAVTAYTDKDRLAVMKPFSKRGINFLVCRNSIKEICPGGDVCMLDDPKSRICINKKGYIFKDVCIAEDALHSFIKIVPAGITEIIKRQAEGYAYVKP